MGGKQLFSEGISGIIIVALVYFIMTLRGELRDERAAHKVELAAKDALILKLQEERLEEARGVIQLAKSTQVTLEGVQTAVETLIDGLQQTRRRRSVR